MRLKMKKPHGTPTFTTHRIRRNMLFGEEEGSRENWKKYTWEGMTDTSDDQSQCTEQKEKRSVRIESVSDHIAISLRNLASSASSSSSSSCWAGVLALTV